MHPRTQNEIIEDLHRTHYASMLKTAYRLTHCLEDAEDIVMSALAKIAPKVQDVAPGKLASYWRCAVKSKAIERWRRGQRVAWESIDVTASLTLERHGAAFEHATDEPPVFARSDQEVVRGIVRDSIEQLAPDHRAVIEMFYDQGLTVREIGLLTDCPESTIKSRLCRARGALRAPLQEKL